MRISACIGGWRIGRERATLIEELSVELQMLAWRSAMSGSDGRGGSKYEVIAATTKRGSATAIVVPHGFIEMH